MNTDRRQLFGLFRRLPLRVASEKRDSIFDSIWRGSVPDMEYGALLILGALIALFGLLQNSAAVIIGAMLISPMMNPLLAGALALLLGSGRLGKRAALVVVASIATTIAVTWLVASLTPLNQATPEILARTAPNLLDLFIAFLSGLAGALALRGGPSSLTILPGVAIAVAVVPPLAVVGFGLSVRQFSIAGGAFLLFLTNLVAIIISAAIAFRSMGFRPQRAVEAGHWKLKYRMAISSGVLLILSVPLFLTLRRAVVQLHLQSDIRDEIVSEIEAEHASLGAVSFAFSGRQVLIRATLHTTKYLDSSQIDALENSLRRRFGTRLRFQIDQILVAEGGVASPPPVPSRNAISGGVVQSIQQKTTYDFKTSQAVLLQHMEAELDTLLASTSIRRTAPLIMELTAGSPVMVQGQFSSPEPIATQTSSLLASQLSSKLLVPVQLNGRVDLLGGPYHLSIEVDRSARELPAAARLAFERMIQIVKAAPALHLQIGYRLPPNAHATNAPPALLRTLQSACTRAGLRRPQWSLQQMPRSEPQAAFPPSEAPSAKNVPPSKTRPSSSVRYNFQVIQTF